MVRVVSCQGNQCSLWKQVLRATALFMTRLSLALIVVLFMLGLSLLLLDQGNVVHAAGGNSLSRVTGSAEPASDGGDAALAAVAPMASGGSVVIRPTLIIQLPLPTYGASQSALLALSRALPAKNVTINLVIKKLEVELELN